jgi:hypothetical protein
VTDTPDELDRPKSCRHERTMVEAGWVICLQCGLRWLPEADEIFP